MSSCSSRALTILSTVFGACGLLLVGVAVSTDYWLIMVEGIILQQNQSMEVKMALHSGLWRVCFVAGRRTQLYALTMMTVEGGCMRSTWRTCTSSTFFACVHVPITVAERNRQNKSRAKREEKRDYGL